MSVKVLIPQPLQCLTQGKDVIEVPAGIIISIIKNLDQQFPGFSERLIVREKVRRFINIYVNEEDIRFLKGEETLAEDGSEVSIIPAMSGGEEEIVGGDNILVKKKKEKRK